MAVRSWDYFGEYIRNKIGDKPSDEDLSVLEDFDDTFKDYSENSEVDWKEKYEANDAEWRKKYKDRFFNKTENNPSNEKEEEIEVKTYEDLFKEEK